MSEHKDIRIRLTLSGGRTLFISRGRWSPFKGRLFTAALFDSDSTNTAWGSGTFSQICHDLEMWLRPDGPTSKVAE